LEQAGSCTGPSFAIKAVPQVENFVSLGATLGLFSDEAKGRELRPVALWQPESNTSLVGRNYLVARGLGSALLEERAPLGLDPSHVFGVVAAFDERQEPTIVKCSANKGVVLASSASQFI
jgi:hypothetical protein